MFEYILLPLSLPLSIITGFLGYALLETQADLTLKSALLFALISMNQLSYSKTLIHFKKLIMLYN